MQATPRANRALRVQANRADERGHGAENRKATITIVAFRASSEREQRSGATNTACRLLQWLCSARANAVHELRTLRGALTQCSTSAQLKRKRIVSLLSSGVGESNLICRIARMPRDRDP